MTQKLAEPPARTECGRVRGRTAVRRLGMVGGGDPQTAADGDPPPQQALLRVEWCPLAEPKPPAVLFGDREAGRFGSLEEH